MITQSPLLSVLPTAVLDMTTDFTPLFVGLVIGLCFCVLALAFAIGVYDSWWSQHKARNSPAYAKPLPRLPELPEATR